MATNDPTQSVPSLTAELGQRGVVDETGTTAITGGDFYALQCLTDTVFSSLTETGKSGDAITGITISAGQILFGQFTAFTLTSGAVRAYKR